MNYIVTTLNERDPAPVHMENLLYFSRVSYVYWSQYIAGFLPSTHILWKKRQGSIDFFSTCKLRTYEQTGLEHARIDEA